MSRMAKLYQGVRARQILDIIIKKDENLQTTVPKSKPSYVLPVGNKSENSSLQIPKKICLITKSLSFSNISKETISINQRRCTSVPPTIKIPYENLEYPFEISSDVFSSGNGMSISLSALTCDEPRVAIKKRSCSVPRTFHYDQNVEDWPILEAVRPTSEQQDDGSYDGDYSGDNSDDTYYCPTEDYAASKSPESNLDQNDPSTSASVYHGDLREGRKRQRPSVCQNWKKNKNKKLRMQGEEYLGYTKPKNEALKQNKMRPARRLGSRCDSQFCKKSKLRNCEKFSDEKRLELHNSFWKQMNWDQRKIYIAGLVIRKKTLRKTINDKSRREGTFDYFLPFNDHQKLQVCRTTFLNTLCLGSFTIQSWVKKSNSGIIPCQEVQNLTRVKTPKSGTQRKLLVANTFLSDLPKLPSHYGRHDSSKLYLEPNYRSMADLYRTYKEHCSLNEELTLCRFTFEKLFREKNFSLYTLKKDMCDMCCGHAVGNIDTSKYEEHILRKNRARQEKENDKKKAESGEFILLSMDLESVKVCPFLTASALYFKSKLVVHNFTIYDLTTHQATCYWFDETAADLTASSFASCLCDYLERHCVAKKIPIHIYSDGCTNQNRNVVMSNALLNFSVLNKINVIQKFLEPGHTQMECDSVHSAIERKLKNREIHLPSDYIVATKEARKNPAPYETVQVNYDFVKNYNDKTTWRYSTIRPGRKVGDPVVVNLRAIQYTPDGIIKFKLKFDDNWSELPIRPKKLDSISYLPLHTSSIPIAANKFKHLQELKEVLPKDCHFFYDTLLHE